MKRVANKIKYVLYFYCNINSIDNLSILLKETHLLIIARFVAFDFKLPTFRTLVV